MDTGSPDPLPLERMLAELRGSATLRRRLLDRGIELSERATRALARGLVGPLLPEKPAQEEE